jgi:hypothetical protein
MVEAAQRRDPTVKEFAEKCQYLDTPMHEQQSLAIDAADSTHLARPRRTERLVRNVQATL